MLEPPKPRSRHAPAWSIGLNSPNTEDLCKFKRHSMQSRACAGSNASQCSLLLNTVFFTCNVSQYSLSSCNASQYSLSSCNTSQYSLSSHNASQYSLSSSIAYMYVIPVKARRKLPSYSAHMSQKI